MNLQRKPNEFTLKNKVLSPKEQEKLCRWINNQPWQELLKRRTQQYGFAYNYSRKRGATLEKTELLLEAPAIPKPCKASEPTSPNKG